MPEIRHRFVITPHFKVTQGFLLDDPDWQDFAEDLCASMQSYGGGSRETQVKVYDAEASAPNFPKGQKTLGVGSFPASSCPREIALCLSYKAGDGARRRGRLYVPAPIITSGQIGLRPSTLHQTKVSELADMLRAAGGVDMQWGVWSRVDSEFHQTETSYIDNEWDVMRSRGMPPTARQIATPGA